jgi:hypothetical protein
MVEDLSIYDFKEYCCLVDGSCMWLKVIAKEPHFKLRVKLSIKQINTNSANFTINAYSRFFPPQKNMGGFFYKQVAP